MVWYTEGLIVMKYLLPLILLIVCIALFIHLLPAQELYIMPEDVQTRWTSFENPGGEKGAGGKANKGAKGHAYDRVLSGETVTLLDMEGAGIIRRIWMTINHRDPEMLRSLRIDMFWDGAEKPAVSVPFGDFFGVGLGRRVPFESALFSDPEGRSFNCVIPMPFKEGARVTITNESERDLMFLFFDIHVVMKELHENDVLYFHAFWNRDLNTTLGEDYEILPKVKGSGRFLGTNIGIITNPVYKDSWWGEGEVKMYLDGDDKFPTLVGTGTEDYIGAAWGQGTFAHRYQGSLIVDDEKGHYAFYRYHIPDPVWFHEDLRVTIQQMGGDFKDKVIELIETGAPLQPVTAGNVNLLELDPVPDIRDPDYPEGWTNFYREDDVSSVAYFYLNRPASDLPVLSPVHLRIKKLID